jgi:hypothetical protein
MALWHCGVSLSESKLMVWDPVLRVQIFIDFFNTSFSSTFEIVGSKRIGRYDETSIGFFPGLCIIIICAIIHDLGHYSSRSMALNIHISFASPSFGSSFSILAVIRLRPGAFLGLIF